MKQKIVKANVKKHLLKGKSITPAQCRALFKGDRLASVIHRLRKEFIGTNKSIESKRTYTENGDQFSTYKLVRR